MTEDTKQKPVRYVAIQYRDLRVPIVSSYTKEVGGRVVTYPGKVVEFKDGGLVTEDPEAIAFLDASPMYGSQFIRVRDDEEMRQMRKEYEKNLEDKEKELAEKEKELARREALLSTGVATGKTRTEELMQLTVHDLTELLKKRKLSSKFVRKDEAVARLVEDEERKDGDEPKYLSMATVTATPKVNLYAQVFRARTKPKGVPVAIWRLLPRSVTHRAENIKLVASTDKGGITITKDNI